jgi:hypothetical protein
VAFSQVQAVNSALEDIGSQAQITSLGDGSSAALAASVIYTPTVQLLMRELDPDFAMFTAPLTLSAAVTPVPPWAYEFLYPADCVRLRQVRPAPADYAAFDPQPIRAQVAFDVISAVNTKVILTNQQNAQAVYTSSNAPEALWDAVFFDAFVRRLASPLAMALAGRPDFAEKILEQAAMMAQTAEMVDEGGFRRGMS